MDSRGWERIQEQFQAAPAVESGREAYLDRRCADDVASRGAGDPARPNEDAGIFLRGPAGATAGSRPLLLSDLARGALRAANDSASPRPPGPVDLLAAISEMSGQPGIEAEELSSLLRSAGWEGAALKRLIPPDANSNETLDSMLVRAGRLRNVEGAAAVDCRHLLLALIQQPSPDLLRQLAEAGLPLDADDLFVRTVTMKAPVRRVRGGEPGRRMIEYYRGRLLAERYEVLDGAFGGMGCVLFCLDREAGRSVALKLCSGLSSPALLLEEARKWILLGAHPHIVRALYAGQLPAPALVEPRVQPRLQPAAEVRLKPPAGPGGEAPLELPEVRAETLAEPPFEPIRYLVPVARSFPAGPGIQPPTVPPSKQPTGFRPTAPMLYIALEMIPKSTRSGCSLRDWLDDTPQISSSAILRWLHQIADALEYAHATHGLIHQDIKPDNILITPSGDAKLTDFGVASRTGGSRVLGGTPAYMAPEHRAGHPSVQSDIYSFGITLAESFLAHVGAEYLALVRGGEPGALSEKQLAALMLQGRPTEEAASLPLCQDLARLVKTCTNPDPALRYPGFVELKAALAGLAAVHVGLELRTTEIRPEASASEDLLNQGLALLWLQPARQDAAYAGRLLMQAALQSAYNPLFAGIHRRFLMHMDTRGVLRFCWQHAGAGMRRLQWWSWLLAAVAAYGLLLYFSGETVFVKVSSTVLVLVLAVEAYVNFLSSQSLGVFRVGVAGSCVILYEARWLWHPAHLTWAHESVSLIAALGAWACFVGFYFCAQSYAGDKFIGLPYLSAQDAKDRVSRWKLSRSSLNILLPVLLFLGGPGAFLFLILFFIVGPIFGYASRRLARRQKTRLAKQGISMGRAEDRDLIHVFAPLSPQFLVCAVIVMLYEQTLIHCWPVLAATLVFTVPATLALWVEAAY